MATTIQISEELLNTLKARKIYGQESYEDIIWDILEDTLELSEEAKRDILEAEKDIKAGRVRTLDQVKKEIGIK